MRLFLTVFLLSFLTMKGGYAQQSSTELSSLFNACADASIATGNDDAILQKCRDLETAAAKDSARVGHLIDLKASGHVLSSDDFVYLASHISDARLADSALAEADYRRGDLKHGRLRAVEAIGWAFFDAKDMHDYIATLHTWVSNSDYPLRLTFLRATLADDKTLGDRLDHLYPGALKQAMAQLNPPLTVSEYRASLASL